jgi:hypothetical protein
MMVTHVLAHTEQSWQAKVREYEPYYVPAFYFLFFEDKPHVPD